MRDMGEIGIGDRVWHRRLAQYGTVLREVEMESRSSRGAHLSVTWDDGSYSSCWASELELVPDSPSMQALERDLNSTKEDS
jgi:hypothetical protein